MKRLYVSLPALLCLFTAAFAQNPAGLERELRVMKPVPGSETNQYKTTHAGDRGGQVINMYINYSDMEEFYFGSQYFDNVGWEFNMNYTNPPDTFTQKYVIVDFDSIHDVATDLSYDYDDIESIFIDTIYFQMGHVNHSGQNDTLIVDIIGCTNSGYPTSASLWGDTTITATTLVGPDANWFGTFTLAPEYEITAPNKFGVRMRYWGPKEDTATYLFGFNNGGACGTGQYSAIRTLFEWNSYYWFNQFGAQYPTSSGGFIYLDCDGSGNYTPNAHEDYFIQNIHIWLNATVTFKPVAVEEIEPTFELELYPNPAQDVLNLSMQATQSANYTITITNIEGQVTYTEDVNGSSKFGHNIDLTGFSDGVYFLKVNDGASLLTKQFVINR
jgi:hypothetical protein